MLTSYSHSFKTWIMAQNSENPDMPVGQLLDFVIHPDSGNFEALWVRTPEGNKLLAPQDIISWNDAEITISEESEILKLEEFPRIESFVEREISILGARVFQNPGKIYVGKVVDFGFDTISPKILSLMVRSGFWVFGEERIISREAIEKITEEGIFVSQPMTKIKRETVEKEAQSNLNKARVDFRKDVRKK